MHANTYKETSLRISNSCFNGDPPKPMMGPKKGLIITIHQMSETTVLEFVE